MPQPRHTRILAVLTAGRGQSSLSGSETLELQAFLTPDARLDFANHRIEQPVRRLRDEQPTWTGWLFAAEGGWALRGGNGEDAPLWHLTADRLRPGEHLTLRGPDGEDLVFRVVNVTAVEAG